MRLVVLPECFDMATIVEQILKKPVTAKPVVQDTAGARQSVPANNGVEPAKPNAPQKSVMQPLTDKSISPVQVVSNNAAPSAEPISSVQPASKSIVPENPLLQTQHMTMTDIYQKLNPYTPPSQEQLEKERRRDKASRVINAIGDGIGALSNLYFTTKGAPSVQISPSNTLSGVYKKRYDEMTAKRKEERDKWVAGYLNAAGQDKAQGNTDRAHAFQRERAKKQDDNADRAYEFQVKQAERTWNRAGEQDAENKRRWEEQFAETKKNGAASRANAAGALGLRKQQLDYSRHKDKETRVYNFQKSQGKTIPFSIGDKTYVVGSNALNDNIGNMAGAILYDLRNSDNYKDLSDEELEKFSPKSKGYKDMQKQLDPSKVNPKQLAETVKKYASTSPSAQVILKELHDYYAQEKAFAESGESRGGNSLGIGWDKGSDSKEDKGNKGNSLGLGW